MSHLAPEFTLDACRRLNYIFGSKGTTNRHHLSRAPRNRPSRNPIPKGWHMTASDCNVETFLRSLNGKDLMDLIYSAEQEAVFAERSNRPLSKPA